MTKIYAEGEVNIVLLIDLSIDLSISLKKVTAFFFCRLYLPVTNKHNSFVIDPTLCEVRKYKSSPSKKQGQQTKVACAQLIQILPKVK